VIPQNPRAGFQLLGKPRELVVPRWIPIALGEIGVIEWTVPGQSNPEVEKYHAATSGGPATDDVAWCASGHGWVYEQAGIRSLRTKRAADYAKFGVAVPLPELHLYFGCTIVFDKTDPDAKGSGHVGFNVGVVPARDIVYCLGGNQGDRWDIGARKLSKVIAARWPTSVQLPGSVPPQAA
jgi:uncharacterized protein (TIGR02594 family)